MARKQPKPRRARLPQASECSRLFHPPRGVKRGTYLHAVHMEDAIAGLCDKGDYLVCAAVEVRPFDFAALLSLPASPVGRFLRDFDGADLPKLLRVMHVERGGRIVREFPLPQHDEPADEWGGFELVDDEKGGA